MEPHWHTLHTLVHHLLELHIKDNLEPHYIKLHGLEPLSIILNMLGNHQFITPHMPLMLIEESSISSLQSRKVRQILKHAEQDFAKSQIFL
jgi:hypothetical protein